MHKIRSIDRIILVAFLVCVILSSCGTREAGNATTVAAKTEATTQTKATKATETTEVTTKETEEITEEPTTEAPDPFADCPEGLRDILEDAKSDAISYEPLYTFKMKPLEWINSLSVSGNKFADYIKEKRADLHLNKLSDRDRDIMYILLLMSNYGYLKPLQQEAIHVVASGYDKNGKGNMKNSEKNDGKSCTRIVYVSDDEYIYYYMIFVSKKDGKEEISGIPIQIAISDWHASNFVDMTKFKEQGGVTPDNVIYKVFPNKKLTYTQIDYNFSPELREFLYVYGAYAREIGYPKEKAKEDEAKKKEEEQRAAQRSTQKSTRSGSSSGGSYGGSSGSNSTKKSDKKKIDPDDLDIERYYEDHKDEFDDIDDAWDDLLDNPDLWDDYY